MAFVKVNGFLYMQVYGSEILERVEDCSQRLNIIIHQPAWGHPLYAKLKLANQTPKSFVHFVLYSSFLFFTSYLFFEPYFPLLNAE
ncbi:hypothetical protein RJT34_18980 [Clitoria ternatea]|uniref:Uncharacterized protein n=1 Tax=Clitoria ternatea TaxID=43366 RepID=A0AAN9P2R1_CLITE